MSNSQNMGRNDLFEFVLINQALEHSQCKPNMPHLTCAFNNLCILYCMGEINYAHVHCHTIDAILYSRNLSRVKTFTNFAVLGQSVKVLTTKIFIEYGGVLINGRVIVISHNSWNF